MKILVGVDGSPESRQAVCFAAKLACGTGRKLLLAWVAPELELMGIRDVPPAVRDWHRENEEQGRAMLREVIDSELHPYGDPDCEGEPLTSEPPETEVMRGSPAEELARRAERDDVEIVVIGSRGRRVVARLLLGSVADRMAHISPKPVLIHRTATGR